MENYQEKKESMEKFAGRNLVKTIYEVFNEEEAVRWFYSGNVGLGNSRPYDFCRANEWGEVEDLLGRIKQKNF